MKRLLYLSHRWLGILLCLFMAGWFFSGVVMMYVGYPKLTPQEHLQSLPPLAAGACCVPLKDALAALPAGSQPKAIRLTTLGSGPAYLFTLEKSRYVAVDARNGRLLPRIDETLAGQSASAFLPGAQIQALGQVTEDAWTHSRALDGHRPLWVFEANDPASTRLYVSGTTSEVVRDASLTERRWNWVGAWLHWLYPFRGGVVNGWWADIVIYTALAATVLSLIGIGVGLLRWRRRPYANGSHSPYRTGMARWHHLGGLIFGSLVLTWIFSGLMSMNPWKVFDSGASPLKTPLFQPAPSALSVAGQLACLQTKAFSPVELSWVRLDEQGFVLAHNVRGESRLLPENRCAPALALEPERLIRVGTALLPVASLAASDWVNTYDWHYYGRAPHTMGGHQEKPLPVLRLQFGDAAETWLYLDPRTGSVVQRSDRAGRTKRFLFAFLHSWDWPPLLAQRPLWDGLMIGGSLGGFVVSITGVVMGWRRLRRTGHPQGRISPPRSAS